MFGNKIPGKHVIRTIRVKQEAREGAPPVRPTTPESRAEQDDHGTPGFDASALLYSSPDVRTAGWQEDSSSPSPALPRSMTAPFLSGSKDGGTEVSTTSSASLQRRLEAARSPSTQKVPRSDSAPLLIRHDTPVQSVADSAAAATPPSSIAHPHVYHTQDEDDDSNDGSSDPDTKEYMKNIFLGPARSRIARVPNAAAPHQPLVTQQDRDDMKRIQDWHRAREGRTTRLEGDVAEQIANQHLRPEGRRPKGSSPQKRPHPVTPEHDVFFSSERARQTTTAAASPSRTTNTAQLLPLAQLEEPRRAMAMNPAPTLRPPVKKAKPTEGEKLMKAFREVGKQEARELQRDIENMRAKRNH